MYDAPGASAASTNDSESDEPIRFDGSGTNAGSSTYVGAEFMTIQGDAAVTLTAPITALVATCAAVAYHDLRVEKEGASIDDLVEVFA